MSDQNQNRGSQRYHWHIRSLLVIASAFLTACATAPIGTPLGYVPPVPHAIQVTGKQLDTLAYLGVEARVAGSTVGAHYDGLLKVYQYAIQLSADVESAWSAGMHSGGLEMLRKAGYPVKQVSGLFAQSQNLEGVRHVLAGRLTSVQVNTYGRLAGGKTSASIAVAWELFDRRSKDVVYRRSITADASTSGTSGAAFYQAFQESFATILADSEFVRAVTPTNPVVSTATEYANVNWRRPTPGKGEIITLAAADLAPVRGGTPFETVAPAVFSLRGSRALGTGFFITKDGLALTNHHVIADQGSLRAKLHDSREYPVRVLRFDSKTDVALIQVACSTDCPTATIGNDATLQPGQDVHVIGTPLSETLNHTLTKGIVSGVRLYDGTTLVQTDAAINGGNSGGPVIESSTHRVVAISTWKMVGSGIEGLSFGVAITDALRVLGVRIAR